MAAPSLLPRDFRERPPNVVFLLTAAGPALYAQAELMRPRGPPSSSSLFLLHLATTLEGKRNAVPARRVEEVFFLAPD